MNKIVASFMRYALPAFIAVGGLITAYHLVTQTKYHPAQTISNATNSDNTFGKDPNTELLDQWLHKDVSNPETLRAWMKDNKLNPGTITSLLYLKKFQELREKAVKDLNIRKKKT